MQIYVSYMTKSALFILLLFLSSLLAAQPGNQKIKGSGIAGRIVDEYRTPIPYATIAVYKTADSALVDGGTSDDEGRFFVPLPPGKYYMAIRMISFNDTSISGIEIGKELLRLGDIRLRASAQNLEEVQIRGQRNQMELKLDKRVFNVGQDLTSRGTSASEILDNLPSVNVDVEGNVTLRGSGNVIILVDGKPSAIVRSGDPQSLRQLRGEMIEKIEVITNPSARYDAEGEVGIINIILKKKKQSGFNGSVDVNAGYPLNEGAALNFNYRKAKVNFFLSEGFNVSRFPGGGHSTQTFNLPDTSFSYIRDRVHSRGDLSNTLRLGADVFFSPKDVLTLSGTYQYADGKNYSTVTYYDLNAAGDTMDTVIRDEDEREIENNVEFNLRFDKQFDSKEHKLTFDVRYSMRDDAEESNYNEQSAGAVSDPILQRSINAENRSMLQAQLDYVYPFAKDGKFETGVKVSARDVLNDYTVEQDMNGQWEVLSLYDNTFRYDENIFAAYLMLGNKYGKISLQGGLRAEYSDITTTLVKTNEHNVQQYPNLFPSFFLGYELSKKKTLQMSYSRRISRPHFWLLLPFFTFSDSRNFFSGNPNLRPEFTNSFEVNYLQYLEKGSIVTGFYYRHRSDVIDRITTVDSTGFTRMFPVNLATEKNYGYELSVNYDIRSWWDFNGSFNFYKVITEGSYADRIYDRNTFAWTTRASTKITVARKLSTQATFRYRGPQETTQGRMKGIGSLDLATSMDVLKGKGTLVFSVRDVFNTRKRRVYIEGPGYTSYHEFQWRSRIALLSFNYRINQKKRRGRNGGFNGGGFEGMGM